MFIGRPRSPLTLLLLLIAMIAAVALLLLIAMGAPQPAAASAPPARAGGDRAALPRAPLYVGIFTLARSTNENLVVYEVRLGPAGFVAEAPIRARWLMLAESGQIEELSSFEQRVYGAQVEAATPEEVRFSIAAFPSRPLRVRLVEGVPRALIEIAGSTSLLDSIYVSASGGLFPSVRYVDLRGHSLEDGAERRERIRP